jgi:GDP-L-fucose synthase
VNKSDKIYLAGHRGLVGSAIERELSRRGYNNIITRTSGELDLRDQGATNAFFGAEKPDYVFLAAAKVGGILANSTYQAEFIYDNTMIAANAIHASYRSGVKKLLNLGSSCIFPKMAPQPLREDSLLTGPLEPTNEPYAIAKIAAIKLCRYYNEQYGTNYVSIMPTNLYGPGDNFDLETSHVLPALIRKFHEAKVASEGRAPGGGDAPGPGVVLWGDGSPYREFLYSEDLADAAVTIMERFDAPDLGEFVNVGTGKDLTIRELADLIARVVGYDGPVRWDTSKPNGTPRKLLDVSRLEALGWKPKTGLREGVEKTYRWFLENHPEA